MLQKSLTIVKNSFKRKNLSVMIGKVFLRLQEANQNSTKEDVLEWCKSNSENYETFMETINLELWEETQKSCKTLEQQAQNKLKNIDIDLGGGGNYLLLYFLTRYTSARTIVETGVAAGWSSQAILTAIQKNKNNGHLYSSDFPYFRHENPEKLVGYVVEENLKKDWTLFIDGDQNNLPKIHRVVKEIDLFHYDSDKSYKGRTFAADIMKDKCHDKTVIIYDDIQDNSHFKDYVANNKVSYKVFEFGGKYVGLTAAFLKDQ